jgi:hypothetical protein
VIAGGAEPGLQAGEQRHPLRGHPLVAAEDPLLRVLAPAEEPREELRAPPPARGEPEEERGARAGAGQPLPEEPLRGAGEGRVQAREGGRGRCDP